jgi:pimeloyl-ACP methyl ester carboxylesterase
MDGTAQLFDPLLRVLPPSLSAVPVAYPADRACGYADLLPLVETAVPAGAEFVVLGESFSGPLALLLAARRPPGLRGVILCASFARSPLPPFLRWFRGLVQPWCFRVSPTSLVCRALLGRFQTEPLRRQVQAALAGVQPAVLAARARAILTVDVGAALQESPVPILYLSATEDRLVSPRSLACIRRLHPAVEAVTLTGPHLLLQAAPQESAQVIQAFVARCTVPSSS